jgi:hypothetical protein
MDAGIEELDAPVAELTRLKARVSRSGRVRLVPTLSAEGGPKDQSAIATDASAMIPSMAFMASVDPTFRASWVVTAVVVVFMLALVVGDDGPWIVVIPGLTAVGLAWLDRRIAFSFAEGFIGYCADPGPARGDIDESWPAPRGRSAPAAA